MYEDAELPDDIELYDLEDFDTHRKLIFDDSKTALEKQFPKEHNGVRMELKNVKFSLLENLGKASYHILMVQILYYNFFAPLVWTAPKNVIPNDAVGFVIGLVICLGGGYGYYKLYGLIAGKYRALKNRDK